MDNNNWRTTALVAITILTFIGLMYGYIRARDSFIESGYNQAIIDMAVSQTQTGNIVLVRENKTITTIPILNICNGDIS